MGLRAVLRRCCIQTSVLVYGWSLKKAVSKPLVVCQHSQAAGIKPLFSPSQVFLRVKEDLQVVQRSPWQHSQSMSHWWQ